MYVLDQRWRAPTAARATPLLSPPTMVTGLTTTTTIPFSAIKTCIPYDRLSISLLSRYRLLRSFFFFFFHNSPASPACYALPTRWCYRSAPLSFSSLFYCSLSWYLRYGGLYPSFFFLFPSTYSLHRLFLDLSHTPPLLDWSHSCSLSNKYTCDKPAGALHTAPESRFWRS